MLRLPKLPLLCNAALIVHRGLVNIIFAGNENLLLHFISGQVIHESLHRSHRHLAGKLLRGIVELLFKYPLLAGRRRVKRHHGDLLLLTSF